MWMTRVAIANPVFATMVMVALTVVGLFSAVQLGVEAMPDVKLPFVAVNVDYPGASPEQVENDISKPIETAVNGISGVKSISALAREGSGHVFIEFRDGTDVNRAIQDVRDRVAQARGGLPREARDPVVNRADTDNQQPIVMVSLSAASRTQRDLTVMAEQVVRRGIERAPGVGAVFVGGTVSRQIQVRIDPARLASYGITVDQVEAALRAENTSVPVGLVHDAHSEAIIRVDGRMRSPAEFDRIVVARRGGSVVRLGQVATTVDAQRESESISRINGQPSVSLWVFKSQDANVVSTGRAVRAAITEVTAQLPEDVHLKSMYDMSEFVEGSIANVRQTILEGGLLTVLIVLLFLGSWRSTVITGLTLPIAVIATLSAIYAMGFTLNYMTLMALSLCIGLLIDDAIVVRENIVRHLRMGKAPRMASLEGTQEVGLAVLATTLSIVAVFVPIAFMKGILGKFFFPFGVTVAVSVMLSLFVSFTLDPMLSSIWHDPARPPGARTPYARVLDGFERGFGAVQKVYERLLSMALAHRWRTMGVATLAFLTGVGLFLVVGGEFMPEADQSFLSLQLTMPVGSSLEYSDSRVRIVEERLKAFPEIEAADTQIGTDEGRNNARINLMLVPPEKRSRSQKQLQGAIREALGSVAGVRLSVGFDFPIFVNLMGNNDADLARVMQELRGKIEKIKGIRDVETSLKDGTPAVSVRLKPDLAGEIGMTHAQLGQSLGAMFGGHVSGYWPAPDGQNYEVVTLIPSARRTSPADVGALELSTGRVLADGAPEVLPLHAIADIEPMANPENIRRRNLQRRVALFANVEGRPSGDVGKEVNAIVQATQLPPGLKFEVNGDFEQLQDSLAALGSAVLLAVIFIYIVLASQFGSFLQPIAIMASLPLSIVGVNLALLATGTTLNIFSMIGVVFLMGLVTKNAILLVDFANRGQAQGLPLHEALMQAGRIRLRPILMTTAAMVFGMIPLSLGIGAGAEQQAPMGRAIIGGVITSTLLTLVVVPVIYSFIAGWENRRRERRAARSAQAIAASAS
jgi:HAE1 family hydrophobic/amphiphilic exporter-1